MGKRAGTGFFGEGGTSDGKVRPMSREERLEMERQCKELGRFHGTMAYQIIANFLESNITECRDRLEDSSDCRTIEDVRHMQGYCLALRVIRIAISDERDEEEIGGESLVSAMMLRIEADKDLVADLAGEDADNLDAGVTVEDNDLTPLPPGAELLREEGF